MGSEKRGLCRHCAHQPGTGVCRFQNDCFWKYGKSSLVQLWEPIPERDSEFEDVVFQDVNGASREVNLPAQATPHKTDGADGPPWNNLYVNPYFGKHEHFGNCNECNFPPYAHDRSRAAEVCPHGNFGDGRCVHQPTRESVESWWVPVQKEEEAANAKVDYTSHTYYGKCTYCLYSAAPLGGKSCGPCKHVEEEESEDNWRPKS